MSIFDLQAIYKRLRTGNSTGEEALLDLLELMIADADRAKPSATAGEGGE